MLALLLGTSCATPPARPLDPGKLVIDVAGRSSTSPDILLAALALHDAPPLGLTLPDRWNPRQDTTKDVFWHAHAIAFEPTVQASRRRWRAARKDAAARGLPDRANLSFGAVDGDPEPQGEIVSTMDLLGLLGIGPKAAERNVAIQMTDLALGQLEQNIWAAAFDVDRARVRLAASRRRDAELAILAAAAKNDLRRMELLYARGYISNGLIGRARAIHATFETQRHHRAIATVRAHEALALASGLPPQAPALDTIGDAMLELLPAMPAPSPEASHLLETLPELRASLLAYALAEANLRAAVSAWWPNLRIGPQLKIQSDEFLAGGIMALDLPWPGTISARIDAAVERREQFQEAVESTLAKALASVTARRKELVIVLDHYKNHAQVLGSQSEQAWRAARARILIEESAEAIDLWVDAFRLRSQGVLSEINAMEQVRLGDLSFREAAGLRPGLDQEDHQ